jgi:hypothetical protein
MATIRLRYVHSFSNRDRKNARVRYYFRRRGKKAIPLPGQPGSEEFMAAYGMALSAIPDRPEIGASRTLPGSINALVVNYYRSAEWQQGLAEQTKRVRRGIIERFRARHGDKRVALLRREHIEKMLGQIAKPSVKNDWLKAIRSLLRFAVPTMLKADPTAGIFVKLPKGKGHHTWTDEEIKQYRAYWPLGTEQRLVMEFAFETASRRGEVVRLGPQHVRNAASASSALRAATMSTFRCRRNCRPRAGRCRRGISPISSPPTGSRVPNTALASTSLNG